MKKKEVFFWVATSNPFNSIYFQIKYLSNLLSKQFAITPIIINPETKNLDLIFKDINSNKKLIFWHYGGFDSYLRKIDKSSKNVVFIYHNITPARFFITTEPMVALRSLLGRLQILFLSKENIWITMSDYNKRELEYFGFKEIILCYNIIKLLQTEAITKTDIPSILYVGRLAQNKNIHSLIKQVDILAKEYKHNMRFVIVGSAKRNTYFEKKTINLLNKLVMNKNLEVVIRNHIDDFELNRYYKESWLYVSMSLHEGFGVPVCESILNGTPAIYLESGGQESILNNFGKISKLESDVFHKYIYNLIMSKKQRDKLLSQQYRIVKKYTYPEINKIVYNAYRRFL